MSVIEQSTIPSISMTMDETKSFVAGVKATAIGASTDPVRDILTNVLVIIGDGHIKLVSTNSYMLFVTTLGPYPDMPKDMDITFMVKAKALVTALPKRNALMRLDINLDANRLSVIDHGPGTETMLPLEPGTYPDWQSLIREDKPTLPLTVGMNPKFLADIGKAADIFRGKTDAPIRFRTGQTEMKPMFFDMTVIDQGTFFALLMPVRLS
jgi:DNA polymerase III sliding clamp (beta) subunit (PCNA family)